MDIGTGLSLRRFDTASEMWTHICAIHSQNNSSRQFELESEIALFTQGDRDIRTYYQTLVTKWTEQDMLAASVSDTLATAATLHDRDRSCLMQFLMKLRPEFEAIRASIRHRNVTSIDDALGELFREETRLRSLSKLDGQSDSAFAVGSAGGSRPHFQRGNTGHLTCHYFHEVGHIQPYCKQNNFCIYYKKSHFLECKAAARRNKSGSSTGSRGAPSTGGPAGAGCAVIPAAAASHSSALAPPSAALTQANVRRMVAEALQEALPSALNSAFSTGGGSGISSRWLIDSAAFNHMTNARSHFSTLNTRLTPSLQVANGSWLPTHGVGTATMGRVSLPNTLYVPKLVPQLVSVG
ncbi:unnamed protein product [Linum trigynum]|uniref:Retrovirus-related Pol polyprotein from transposon TNT 1-94-like beta-barrel domain-containing protein n=1 Tax=Linum trigynum TaxID=586398 RepID=A0AAV2GBE7_9ROSI